MNGKCCYPEGARFKRVTRQLFVGVCICVFISGFYPISSFSGGIPTEGSFLPQFQLQAPPLEEERAYLGIGSRKLFFINEVDSPYILIEIMSVYCPQCHEQAPLFNKLFYRIKKNSALSKKVKMVAVAIGANPTEVSYVKKEFHIPFPIVMDPEFSIHKLLGEPRTPFTIFATKEGKVVFAHLGVIEDIDSLLLKIGKLAP